MVSFHMLPLLVIIQHHRSFSPELVFAMLDRASGFSALPWKEFHHHRAFPQSTTFSIQYIIWQMERKYTITTFWNIVKEASLLNAFNPLFFSFSWELFSIKSSSVTFLAGRYTHLKKFLLKVNLGRSNWDEKNFFPFLTRQRALRQLFSEKAAKFERTWDSFLYWHLQHENDMWCRTRLRS